MPARVWLAVMLAGSTATAQPVMPGEGPKGAMPDETWGVVMVDRGTRWREHGPTRRLVDWAVKSSLFAGSQAAWEELAGSMGLEGQAAFDALLGERAMLVLGEPKNNTPPAWGVTACVTPQNGTTLERGLDAAPRGFDQGRPVMLVERGKYRLSKLDRRDGIEEVDGWNRMLLSPVETGENPGWIARTIGVAEGLTRSPGEITWYQKTDAKGAYFVASVAQEERGWRAKIRATPEVLGLTEGGCNALSKLEQATPVAAGAEVLLEISGYLPSQASELAEPSKELGLLLAAARVTAPSPQWSGERVLIRVERSARDEQAPGFTVLVACEVKDRRAAAAWFDGLLSGVLEVAGQIQGTGGQAAADLRRDIKLAGNEPSATRLVVLGGQPKREKPAGKSAGVDQGTLAWTTVGEGNIGWWVMQYRLGSADRQAAEKSLHATGAEVASTRWGNLVVSFKARPAELWNAAGMAGLGGDQGMLGLAAEMETVELVLRATPAGLEGEAMGRMTEPKPTVPAAK